MTVTKNSNRKDGDRTIAAMANPVLRFFVSLRLTIATLSLIAATSVLGSFVKQGGTEEEYLALYTEKTYHFIKLFGFDDTYHSPWFYFLIAIFVVNLVLCTLQRMRRLSRQRDARGIPDIKGLVAAGSGFTVAARHGEEIARRICRTYGNGEVYEKGTLYEKGSLSRWGVLVIHSSILTILFGGFIGLVAGYKGFVLMRVGETKDRAVSRETGRGEIPLGFRVKCKDFRVSFYPGGEPKDYVSTVEIIDNAGRVVRESKIRVNDPLSYGGVRFYQSTYGKSNLFTFLVDGKKIVLGEQDVYKEGRPTFMVARFAEQVHNFGPGVMIAYLDGEEPKTAWLLSDVEKMKTRDILGTRISLEKIDEEYYTGLEVSRDPGVPVVLLGFALMLFGLYINFFVSHRRVYVLDDGETISVAGLASRNKEAFPDELGKFREGLA